MSICICRYIVQVLDGHTEAPSAVRDLCQSLGESSCSHQYNIVIKGFAAQVGFLLCLQAQVAFHECVWPWPISKICIHANTMVLLEICVWEAQANIAKSRYVNVESALMLRPSRLLSTSAQQVSLMVLMVFRVSSRHLQDIKNMQTYALARDNRASAGILPICCSNCPPVVCRQVPPVPTSGSCLQPCTRQTSVHKISFNLRRLAKC